MTTLLVEHPVFIDHVVPPGHPERPDRIRVLREALSEEHFPDLLRREAAAAPLSAVTLAHHPSYVDLVVGNVPTDGFVQLDADTYMAPKSLDVALHAVGAANLAVDAVMTGEAANAFCAVRPPGHHAESDRAMGFCIFNNAAIAARHAQREHGAERVAIVDWDVHHGNGTQEIFWSDPSVLYASTHEMPLYPGSGAAEETGAGNIVNAPLAAGDGGARFRSVFSGMILPALDSFRPDLVIVSAGFDAHRLDPLASLEFDEADFAWATRQVMEIAGRHCGGRIVSLLEGGYDLHGLSLSAQAHLAALAEH